MQMCRINDLPYFVGQSESSIYETVDRSKWKFWNWSARLAEITEVVFTEGSTTACLIEIKSLLRKKVLQRISSSDIRATQREKDQGVTENWCHVLLEEGYSSEVASIDN